MAALTTQQEYDAIREAIQTLTATGQPTVSVSVEGMSVSYNASQLQHLAAREVELANRICNKNRRKRVIPGFDFI
jgi:hypothetical protein